MLFISDLSMTTFRRLQPGTLWMGMMVCLLWRIVKSGYGWELNNGLFRYDKKDCFIPYNFVDGIPSSIFTL